MPCVSLIGAPNLRSPRAGRGVLKSMSELQALEQSSRVATRKNFPEENLLVLDLRGARTRARSGGGEWPSSIDTSQL